MSIVTVCYPLLFASDVLPCAKLDLFDELDDSGTRQCDGRRTKKSE